MACWSETVLSQQQFEELCHDEGVWEEFDGGVEEALRDSQDFLQMAQQTCPVVMFLLEGCSSAVILALHDRYRKLQPTALERQLPASLRQNNATGWKGLPAPPPLSWSPCSNLLNPLQHVYRELVGSTAAVHVGEVPLGVVERCKLVAVSYVLKELLPVPQSLQQQHSQQHQQLHRTLDADVALTAARSDTSPPASTAASLHRQQQQQHNGAVVPEHRQVWGHTSSVPDMQSHSSCKRLSFRLVLQRLTAAPLPDEDPQRASNESSRSLWGQQWRGDSAQQGYICTLEYPAFFLKSSDYLVPADVFERGLKSWQALRNGDAFGMPWDGTEYRGCALGYRRREAGDPFFGSPWWSITVEWEGHSTDRKKDPEDWCYGNPWEMTRAADAPTPKLPTPQAAWAAVSKVGHPVLAAPWTTVWLKAVSDAAGLAEAKRKRQRRTQHRHVDDFIYDDSSAEQADTDAGDAWDPAEFYYDDDPEEYEQHPRKSSRRAAQHSARAGWRRHRVTYKEAADRDIKPQGTAQFASAGDLTHNYGRDLLMSTDACLVCGSSDGNLMSGHPGRSSTCTRQYHAGCLLLLNAVGIRSVTLAKAQRRAQQRKDGADCSTSERLCPTSLSVKAAELCDGLLYKLRLQVQQDLQQQQQRQAPISTPTVCGPGVRAVVSAAEEAAVRIAAGELVLCCPAHSCHGCHLNGKLEFMVWCCCCWVRVYHHRQCVPYGAEHVQVQGRDFVRCPHCRAAGVPVPGSAAAASSEVTLAPALPVPAAARARKQRHSVAAVLDVAGTQQAAASVDDGAAGADPAQLCQHTDLNMLACKADRQPVGKQCNTLLPCDCDTAALAHQNGRTQSSILGKAQAGGSLVGSTAAACRCSGQQGCPGAQGVCKDEDVVLCAEQSMPCAGNPADLQNPASASKAHCTSDFLAEFAKLDQLYEQLQSVLRQPQQACAPADETQPTPTQADHKAPLQHQTFVLAAHKLTARQDAASGYSPSPGDQVSGVELGSNSAAHGLFVPPWLLLAMEDTEQLQPSFVLMPHPAGRSVTSTKNPEADMNSNTGGDAGGSAAVLATAAAAAGTLPQTPLTPAAQECLSTGIPPLCARGARVAQAGGTKGLILAGPHSHWLLGCLPKAEAQYRPANSWGCAMIGVPQYPDESVYGLAVVIDYLPALEAKHQQLQQQRHGSLLQASAAAAATSQSQELQHTGSHDTRPRPQRPVERVRPLVYLRCTKAVAANGRLQRPWRVGDEEDRPASSPWQVLVNGESYSTRQGKKGVLLQDGDVVTVQGLTFRLQLAQ